MLMWVFATVIIAAFLGGVFFTHHRGTVATGAEQLPPIPPNFPPPGHPKVVIFYSSIGAGHISAAHSIQKEIHRRDPESLVILQDIRAFMSPVRRRIDERLYWFVVNNLPECFEALFWSMQEEGNAAASLAELPNDYPEEKVLAFLRTEAPQAVIATHYGSAQVMGTLRERGLLPHMKLGWLHTDYFEGYLPRISKRIDRTFLAHPELASRWEAAGVPADLIDMSGMPVNIPPAPPGIRGTTLAGLGLDPALPVVLMIGGKEGVGDYVGVAESLARRITRPAQFLALCGTNARMVETLERLAPRLESGLSVHPFGLVPQPQVAACMRSVDVLITKAGGLTPAEAFSIGVPTVLLDVLRGHERENAVLFERLGLAELAIDATQVGHAVARLLDDRERRVRMLAAQAEFGRNANVGRIAAFALDPAVVPRSVPAGFGTENGPPPDDANGTLARLNTEAPAGIELLLSYSTTKIPERIARENPFGHLAIRIDEAVFSTNHMANPSHGTMLLQNVSLTDYLFGVLPPVGKQQHTSTYGMAYGRDTLGLRVAGIPKAAQAAMQGEANRIEAEFQTGAIKWDRRDFNCADAVARILEAGGYPVMPWSGPRSIATMPLDVFDRALGVFQEDPALSIELIAYRKLPGSQASYRFSRFPLSITQPLRSIARVMTEFSPDALEVAVTRQITGYGDRRLFVEDLSRREGASTEHHRLTLERALIADATRLLKVRLGLARGDLNRFHDQHAIGEIRHIVERGRDLARLATERAEETLIRPSAARLRALFTALDHEYGALGNGHWHSTQIETYLKHLQDFEETVAREFTRLRTAHQWLWAWFIHRLRHPRPASPPDWPTDRRNR